MARGQQIFGGRSVREHRRTGSGASFELDLEAAGCPDHFCLKLGERVERLPLPEGFPRQPLDVEVEVEVYDRRQVCRLASTPNRTSRNVQLRFEAVQLSVPFRLLCGEDALLDGWDDDEEPPLAMVQPDGSITWVIVRRLSGFEKEVAGGGACRPDCRWHSIYVQRNEDSWRLTATRFRDAGAVVIVTQTFERLVQHIWHNFHCESGKWTHQGVAVDNVPQTRTIEFEAV
jgi:hypothetical protein